MNGIPIVNNFLFDTNILIYYLNGVFQKNNYQIDDLIETSFNISIISKIEFLGWAGFLKDKTIFEKAKKFIDNATLYYLDDVIAEEAIIIRQNFSIKIPDAIIGATAKVNNLELITNNAIDFKNINLKIYNPLN
jgi:hypothetical protein